MEGHRPRTPHPAGQILPVPRELTLDNNQAQVEVEVMEDVIKVLVADDLPRWEFRYLVNLFKRDKHVAFEQLLFEPNDDSPVPTQKSIPPSFPARHGGLDENTASSFSATSAPAELTAAQQEMLRKYVSEEGGNLIVIAGQTAMPAAFADQPLGAMIPATASGEPPNPTRGFSLAVTAEGSSSVPTQLDDDPLASERIWREMSVKLPIYNLSPISKPKPTAHVLIAATTPWHEQRRGSLSFLAIHRSGPRHLHRRPRHMAASLPKWRPLPSSLLGPTPALGHRPRNQHRLQNRPPSHRQDRPTPKATPPKSASAWPKWTARPSPALNATSKPARMAASSPSFPCTRNPARPALIAEHLDNLSLGPVTLRAGGNIVATLLAAEGRIPTQSNKSSPWTRLFPPN